MIFVFKMEQERAKGKNMISGYTSNLSVQILISLLKQYSIRKIIISPGTTNLEFTAGVQYDGSFQLYSSVDERSAAYMACGMAEETGETIAIVCTEATASRNYFPGMTEAYYRKLPILAITGVHRYTKIGHLFPQIIDRSVSPRDMIKFKAQLPIIKDQEDVYATEILVNRAIHELTKNGGGPVHIDLPCCDNDYDFSQQELYKARKIERYTYGDSLPELPSGKIAIFLGSHIKFTQLEEQMINDFCDMNDAVIFCDHSSRINSKFAFRAGIIAIQSREYELFNDIEVLLHIGEGIADEPLVNRLKKVKQVWRISTDGEIRDLFGKLTRVFQMTEKAFFNYYRKEGKSKECKYIDLCHEIKDSIEIPYEELPLCNVYIASRIAPRIPRYATIHLGVSNTLRAWTLFDFPETVQAFCNVGCRGIDGGISALIGAAITREEQLHFGVFGDLSFFYDMNSLGNRHVNKNIRILVINNGGGGVFKLDGAPGHTFFGDQITNEYIAAAGHYGNKSSDVIRNYVEAIGFEYLCASNKYEFDRVYEKFVSDNDNERPILFEVFTNDEDERRGFSVIKKIDMTVTSQVKQMAKNILGEKGSKLVRGFISK